MSYKGKKSNKDYALNTARARELARTCGTLDKPLKTQDAARALGISTNSLLKYRRDGLIPDAPKSIEKGSPGSFAIWFPTALRQAEAVILANERKQGINY